MENDIIVYHNLTQCADGDTNKRFVYFRSTDVEQHNYARLLWSVPDEWLYFLSLGKTVKVIDVSSNGSGKIERIFIPILNDIFGLAYFNYPPRYKNLSCHFYLAYDAMVQIGEKFKYWDDKICLPINILAETIHVDKEPNPLEAKDASNLQNL